MHRLPVATQEEPGLWGACFPKRVWVEQKTSVSLRRQPPCFRLGLGSRGACPSQTVRGQQGEKKQVLQTGAVAQWAEHPPGMQKTQGSTPPQLSETRHGHIGEVEAGGSGHQGHPQLHNGFKASLGYTRQCLKKQRIQCTLPQPPPRRSPRRGGQPGQSCLLSAFPSPTPGTNLKSAPVPRPLVPSPQVTPIKDRAASCSQERWDIRGPCIEPPWSL